jgi:hypothetical protein
MGVPTARVEDRELEIKGGNVMIGRVIILPEQRIYAKEAKPKPSEYTPEGRKQRRINA